MRKKTNKLGAIYIAIVLILIYAPILILAVYSFTTSAQIGPITGFSLDNYRTLFTSQELMSMIVGTLLLALVSSALATVFGTLGAIGAFYSKPKASGFINALNQVPVVNADVVTGFSICIALVVVLGIDKETFIPLVVGHTVLSAPFVYLAVVPKLKQMDSSLYEAALDLGATPRQALFKVVFPQISSGVISGFALAFTLSLDDYFIATYTKPAAFDTISTYVVNATKGGQTQIKTALWALSTVIFAVVVLIVLLMNLRSTKQEENKLKESRKSANLLILGILSATAIATLCPMEAHAADKVVIRVCNWEEYIDLGEWGEDELIELDNGVSIMGENSMVDDFEQWYLDTYGIEVEVEYSCFGTNEELYTMLTLGDTYDMVCPSDYMLMKLIEEDMAVPFSDEFYDTSIETNYYAKGVSPFILSTFEENYAGGRPWSDYAACYMWGTSGIVYNPEMMSDEDASSWAVFLDPKYHRQLTLKDNVRDTYFAALGYLRGEELTDEEFLADPEYQTKMTKIMNDVDPSTINDVERVLQKMMQNLYGIESDSGKADLVSGKIVGGYQWSGDAVYSMDQADENGVELRYQVPKEASNLWFDGWLMLDKGINGDSAKQHACEAFVNFVSRPDNAVRNMYYIGYTSSIAGGEDDTIYQYLNWNYSAEDESNAIEYELGYFFSGNEHDENYTVIADADQIGRQLTTQYPSKAEVDRSVVMGYFDETETENINQMWINIRCFNIADIPLYAKIITVIVLVGLVVVIILHRRNRYY